MSMHVCAISAFYTVFSNSDHSSDGLILWYESEEEKPLNIKTVR